MRSAAVVAALALSGCATIIAGGPDDISVTTRPAGAYVYLDGNMLGRTPLVITLDRKRSLGDIRIYYPGYHPVAIHRYLSFNAWTLGNFFLGLIPVVVDLITGDWQRFDDDEIVLQLVPGEAPPPYPR